MLRGRRDDHLLHQEVAELNDRRSRLKAELEGIDSLVLVLDAEGRIVKLNPACEALLGHRFEDVKGKSIRELILTTKEPEAIQALVGASLGAIPPRVESEWLARDGLLKRVAWTSSTLLTLDGEISNVICVGVEQRRGDEDVEDLNQWEPSRTVDLDEFERCRPLLADHEQLASVLAFIEGNFQLSISLRDVAKHAGYSPPYLTDLVRRVSGHTVQAWIISCRISAARALLLDSSHSVDRVAHDVGYSDSRHFTRQFRHYLGMTPKAWRQTRQRVVS